MVQDIYDNLLLIIIIHSIYEDSPLLSFLFRLSLLMLCQCCMLRDWYTSCCVAITICSKQQRPCILVHNTHATQEESAGSRRNEFTGAFFCFHT